MNSNLSSDSDFSWSNEALNTLHLFHGVDVILYVEGIDDIRFWEIVFEKTSTLNIKIIDVGGCENLAQYAIKIKKNLIRGVVAQDSDFHFFHNSLIDHPNIIYTSGYSVENTIVCSDTLFSSLISLGKMSKKDFDISTIQNWLEKLYQDIYELIILDIYNSLNNKGQTIIGNSGARFLNDKNCFICPQKTTVFIDRLKDEGIVNDEDIDQLKSFYPNHIDLSIWLKGHFLFSASQNLISHLLGGMGKKISLSKESFYSSMIIAFEMIFNKESHYDYSYYEERISKIDLDIEFGEEEMYVDA